MTYNHYFNQIQLSSVNPVQSDRDEQDVVDDDSIINELNQFYSNEEQQPQIHKIQSFVYAEEPKVQIAQSQRRDFQFLGTNFESRLNRYDNFDNFRQEDEVFQEKKSNIKSKLYSPSQKAGKPIKKSIQQQLMEENKLLQQKLNSNRQPHHPSQFHKQNPASNRIKPNEIDRKQVKPNKAGVLNDHLLKMQEQYANSTTIKFYNFIMKELPKCPKCHSALTHLGNVQSKAKLLCKRCEVQKEGHISSPLIGILYDLQTKLRFEQEVQFSQAILDGFNKQLQKLKKEMEKMQSIKDKMTQIRNYSRKKYKEMSEVKYFIKKNISKLSTADILELQLKIPSEYLEQIDRWREIDQMCDQKWKHLYSTIYRMMPIYLHDHQESKILSGLYKILNYRKNQEVKLSVSQHIKFPIKQMESAVFMVDGTYNLPVFQNIKHLEMEFQHKKTQRQLNLLFGNLPREIYSLEFAFNHKMHSHISAQNFPFLKYIAPVASIKKLDLQIDNVKEFGDVLRLPEIITPKLQFKLKITKHLFSREELNLPRNYYQVLLERLGANLIKFELSIPESMYSSAKVNYQQLVEKKKLCVFELESVQKQHTANKHAKILHVLNEEAIAVEKRKENLAKKILLQRSRLVRFIKSSSFQKINEKELFFSSLAAIL